MLRPDDAESLVDEGAAGEVADGEGDAGEAVMEETGTPPGMVEGIA